GTNLNRKIAQAHADIEDRMPMKGKFSRTRTDLAKEWMCKTFYDVRTFGAVMNSGPNAGQVRGPVQITFARSIHPVFPLDILMTRMAVADNANGAKNVAAFKAWEENQMPNKMRTMGRKWLISYGLYVAKGFISAHL